MNLLYELSGENQPLAIAEISCVGTVTAQENGIAIAETPLPAEAARLAQTHVISELLGDCDGTADALQEMLTALSITADTTYCCRARKIHPAVVNATQLELERMMGGCIHGTVSLKNPGTEYRAVFSGGHCWFGRVLHTIDRGGYAKRNPGQRAYFHPGVMMPLMARALVNLTHVQKGQTLLDPFCGTGGILLECRQLGIHAIGSDYDPEMLAGCRQNLADGAWLRADATKMPYPDASFDAVATDLPYGQSTTIGAENLENLYRGSLAEIRRVLKPSGRAVVVTHKDIRSFASDFEIVGFYEQRVHKSLTRHILVLR